MPYKTNNDLPSSLKKLPFQAQTLFRKTFNVVMDKYDETTSFKIAWAAVKKKFKLVNGKWVAKGMGRTLFTFETTNSGENFIYKADDGEYYMEGILSTTDVDSDGKKFTSGALKNYAQQINQHGIGGYISHQDWRRFFAENSHLSNEAFVAKARTERKGILKVIKAVYEKGKLWVKAIIDKRYLNHVKKYNKMSIEAIVPTENQVGNTYTGGWALGLALDNRAANQNTSLNVVAA